MSWLKPLTEWSGLSLGPQLEFSVLLFSRSVSDKESSNSWKAERFDLFKRTRAMLLVMTLCGSWLVFLAWPNIRLRAGGKMGKHATIMPRRGCKFVKMSIFASPKVESLKSIWAAVTRRPMVTTKTL